MTSPEIAVVVASHARPLRLRWLLNALEEQTLERERWEVVVAHDGGRVAQELARGHPLAGAGVLRTLSLPPPNGPAARRNAGWRSARAPLIAFTDDDCRPPASWLASAVDAARRHPGTIVQGTTYPDPDEQACRLDPWARTQDITPPTKWGQTCNIVYPRAALEAVGGFDKRFPAAAGEDTDLALRARAAGFRYVGAKEMLTYHAVNHLSLLARVSWGWRWRELPLVVKRHPELRQGQPLGIFWKASHLRFPAALGGVALARRHPAALVLALPWARLHRAPPGASVRAHARTAAQLPAWAAIDGVEVAALAWGSLHHRSLFL